MVFYCRDLTESLLSPLSSLTDLRLDHNLIQTLPERLLDSNKILVTVDMSYNQIDIIPGTMFTSLTRLEFLYLQHNNIAVCAFVYTIIYSLTYSFT